MKTRKLIKFFFSLLCVSLLLIQVTPVALAQQNSLYTTLKPHQVDPLSQVTINYNDAWPMYGHDPAHTGRSPANGPNTPNIKWTWTADGSVSSPVVGTDGSIYVTTYIDIYHQQMVALNPNGTVRWNLETTYGQYYYPTIGVDGAVYVIFNPPFTDDSLLALDPTDGSTIWSFNLGQSSIGTGLTFVSNSRPFVGSDGVIYIASAFGTAGYGTIFALNPNGTQKWSWDTSADDLYCGGDTYLIYCSIESTPALAPNGTLYVKPYGQGVIALNSTTGEYLWRNNFDEDAGGADPFGQSLSIGSDNVAYTTEGYGRFNFYAVNPNNTIKWVTETDAWNDQAISLISADGSLLLRGDSSNLYAFNTSDGTIKWLLSNSTLGSFIDGAMVLSANGIAYYTTGDTTGTPSGTPGYLFAVRIDTGEIVWQYEVGFPAADLAMGADGTLYVPGESGANSVLYAFQCADGICALPQPSCPDPANISTEEDLANCMQLANILTGPQTLGLNADITLHTHLPNIISEIVLNGNGHFVSGNNTIPVLQVNNPGNLTLNAISIQNGRNNFTEYNGNAGSRYSGQGYGGGLYNNMGMVLIKNSTFLGNSVNYSWYGGGGGIYNIGTMTVVNSTFSDNSTTKNTFGGYGGGIYNAGILTVVNSTFSDNSVKDSFGSGGAIYNTGILQLKNSILANSTGFNNCYSTVTLSSNINNLIENAFWSSCGSPSISADPKIGPLANNGGLTKTFALLAGSPAIDAGDDTICANAGTVDNKDQRGVSRMQGSHCDIGAFEFDYSPTISSITRATTSPTTAASVDFTVTFSESVQNVDADGSDFTLVPSSGITGASITGVTGSGSAYTVSVNTGSGSGTLRLDVDSATIEDLNGNQLTGLPFTSGQEYIKTASVTYKSNAANDGWITESSEASNTGGSMNSTNTTLLVGDASGDKQIRTILDFDTSSLPNNAIITSASIKMMREGISGSDPFSILGSLYVDMKNPSFGSSPLELADFSTAAKKVKMGIFNPTPVSGWYSVRLTTGGMLYINRTGATQFRLYFSVDDNDDLGADFIRFFSGNATAANRPKLIIQYYVP